MTHYIIQNTIKRKKEKILKKLIKQNKQCSNFNIDLKLSNIYERKSFKILKKYLNNDNMNVDYNNDWKYDFITDNIKYEVKLDTLTNLYNNYYIEYKCSFKNSGIYHTESDYYIITDTINYYMIETQKIKDIIIKYKDDKNILKDHKRTNPDGQCVQGYLIKCYIINNESIKLN